MFAVLVCFSGCGDQREELAQGNAGVAAGSGGAAASVAADGRGARSGVAGVAGTGKGGAPAGVAGKAAVNAPPADASAAGAAGPRAGATGSSSAGAGAAGMSAAASGTGGMLAEGGRDAGAAGTPSSAHRPCPTGGTACKIMPFGDSITDGYNPNTPGGYRVELFRAAHAAGKNITFVGSGSNGPEMVDGAAFPRNHEGHSGWTIAPAGGRSGVSTLVASVMPQHDPDIVLLMIGTNDAIDNFDMANAPKRLGELIDAIYTQLPDVMIVVATLIPARGDTGMGDDAELNARITRFNEAVPGVVKQRADAGKHILNVDMHAPFEANARALLEDQWHPNAAGYERIGAAWYEVLAPLL